MWTRERQESSLSTELLARFANLKLAGDRAVRDVADVVAEAVSGGGEAVPAIRAAPRGVRRRRRRGGGRRSRHSSRRLHTMTDADLEAELAARHAQRTRERERYARAMRSDKLAVLEMELHRLRAKMPGSDSPRMNGGTPAHARWEALGGGSGRVPSLNAVPRAAPGVPGTPAPHGAPGPPPPPPIGGMPRGGAGGEEEEPVDPEKQRREKEERQRRREAKRKEREAAKKPMTLADIIRSAGKNPMARLKPKGSTATEDVNEAEEEASELSQVALKAATSTKAEKKPAEVSELDKALAKKNDAVGKVVADFLESVVEAAVGNVKGAPAPNGTAAANGVAAAAVLPAPAPAAGSS